MSQLFQELSEEINLVPQEVRLVIMAFALLSFKLEIRGTLWFTIFSGCCDSSATMKDNPNHWGHVLLEPAGDWEYFYWPGATPDPREGEVVLFRTGKLRLCHLGESYFGKVGQGSGHVYGGQGRILIRDTRATPSRPGIPSSESWRRLDHWWTSRWQDKLCWPSLQWRRRRDTSPQEEGSLHKGKGMGVKTPTPIAEVPQNPRAKRKSTFPFKRKSQKEKAGSVVLCWTKESKRKILPKKFSRLILSSLSASCLTDITPTIVTGEVA